MCYFINLSVKLSKLEFAKLIIRYLSIQLDKLGVIDFQSSILCISILLPKHNMFLSYQELHH